MESIQGSLHCTSLILSRPPLSPTPSLTWPLAGCGWCASSSRSAPREAHAVIAAARPEGAVIRARRGAREAVAGQIAAIDAIARRVLGL